jgi:heterodisulfide reductase subunit A-like polyferredoxin
MIPTANESGAGPVGAVLVVGGGIAGIQASLDLSAAGYKVYLLEKTSALGGHMAMLDKTFPTNDCAMCTMSPRLVAVAGDRNIETITQADLVRLQGAAGRLTATVRVRPRFVDPQKCTGCGDCAQACPVELDNEFNQNLDRRKAIHRRYPQAVPSSFVIERSDRPRCMRTCPLGTNPQGYLALVRQRRFHEALRTLRDSNPLPAVCARVCHHPCENACARAAFDAPVSVRAVKRFLTDYCAAHPPGPELAARLAEADKRAGHGHAKPTGKRVAIVGSGPAGLTAADGLARRGHQAVIFEALPVAGGMLRVGIPDFRLPPSVLDADIDAICRLGVEIRCNRRLGRDFTLEGLRRQGFDAVLVAIGAHRGRRLGIPGEETRQVRDGLSFLRNTAGGETPRVGQRVVVVGGGNAAVDVARVARRLGGKLVTILYRRSEAEMPAIREEVDQARAEGVRLEVLAAPLRVVTQDGLVVGLQCVRMALGDPDESGRRRPVPVPGSEFLLDADTVITAIGQESDLGGLGGEIATARDRCAVDERTLACSTPGVFAAGDVATGPDTVTGAMASGRRAAVSIDNYLAGRPLDESQPDPPPAKLPPVRRQDLRPPRAATPRQEEPQLPADWRVAGFQEVALSMEEAVAVAEAERCLDCGVCSDCRQCERVCQAGAIRFDDRVEDREIEIGGVVLADGYAPYDARRRGEFGYTRYPNVVTSLTLERLLSASGPTFGRIVRPSDGKEVRRIAFIQCVGSRDSSDRGHPYCSSICCMQTAKAAMIAMEHTKGLSATVFMIDVRAHGKGYETYYQRAERLGVRYLRSMPSAIRQDFKTHDLQIEYAGPDGTKQVETFDLVVLSVGVECTAQSAQLAAAAGVERDEYGFIRTQPENPVATSREGVLVCGTACGPKDIPDCVAEGSAAAASLARDLAPARFTRVTVPEYPAERDVSAEPPRVGVFVCHCGNNISGVVNVEELVSFAKGLPRVVHAERNLYTCSPEGLAAMRRAIDTQKLNRVVVASCTPRTHTAVFQDVLAQAGLNKYLLEMANIRDQCSWVHPDRPVEATRKALELLAAAVAKAQHLRPLREGTQAVVHAALVVGGGLAGMVAATTLASQGFEVHLVEQTDSLGGQMRHIRRTLDGLDVQALREHLVRQTETSPLIIQHLRSTVTRNRGSVGNFESEITADDGSRATVRHGVTIVAAGANMYTPTEYGHGTSSRVITQREFERRLGAFPFVPVDGVVMIQCVGCRNAERPYCSRVCCAEAVKNALEIKAKRPGCRVVILYKDVRTFGRLEKYYRQAREAGVVFIRYDDAHPPQVSPDGVVRAMDPALGRELTWRADVVVLSAATVGRPEHRALAEVLRVPMTSDGFFLEAHAKLRPVDFACEGVFLAGTAHSPKLIPETIAQALAAAGRAATILCQDILRAGGAVSVVNRDRCAACLTCVRLCPYGVPRIEKGAAAIEPTACQGCGLCAAECPAGAITLECFTDQQMQAAVGGLFLETVPQAEEAPEA